MKLWIKTLFSNILHFQSWHFCSFLGGGYHSKREKKKNLKMKRLNKSKALPVKGNVKKNYDSLFISLLKSASTAGFASFLLTCLAYLQFSKPFIYHYRIIKIAMYSFTIFPSFVAETLLKIYLKLSMSDSFWYLFTFMLYFLLFLIISIIFFRSGRINRKRIILGAIAIFIVYVPVMTYFLW